MVVAVDDLYLYSLLSIRWWLTIKKYIYTFIWRSQFFVHICEYIDRKAKEIDILYWLIWKWRQKKRNEQINKRYKYDRIVCCNRQWYLFDCLFRFFSHTLLTRTQNDIDLTSLTIDMKTESFTPYTIIITIYQTYMFTTYKNSLSLVTGDDNDLISVSSSFILLLLLLSVAHEYKFCT